MKSYYFRHLNSGLLLAAVYARTEDEAWAILPSQHTWIDARKGTAVLEKVQEGTQYDRMCQNLPLYGGPNL